MPQGAGHEPHCRNGCYRSPFPSDLFTVADDNQNTGRRVNLALPADCRVEASECEDRAVLNQLDGFNLQARISVPFSGDIDPSSVTSGRSFCSIAIQNLLSGIFALVVGRLADRVGARKVILPGVAIVGVLLLSAEAVGAKMWELYLTQF